MVDLEKIVLNRPTTPLTSFHDSLILAPTIESVSIINLMVVELENQENVEI